MSGGDDQRIVVYGLNSTFEVLNTLGNIHGTVWALEWIATHSVLASGSADGVIRLWPVNVLTSVQTCHIEANGNGNNLCCDGDGLGCDGRYAASWRNTFGMLRARAVHGLAWISSTSQLASAWGDGVVRLWSINISPGSVPLTQVGTLNPAGRVKAFAWVSGASHLAMVSTDWNLPELFSITNDTAEVVLTLDTDEGGFGTCELGIAHCGGVYSVASDSSGTYVGTGGEDGVLRLWNPSTSEPVNRLTGHTGTIGALAWLDSESNIASGGADGAIKIWAYPSSSSASQTISNAHTDAVSGLSWVSSAGLLASASYDTSVRVWSCT